MGCILTELAHIGTVPVPSVSFPVSFLCVNPSRQDTIQVLLDRAEAVVPCSSATAAAMAAAAAAAATAVRPPAPLACDA